MPNWWGGWVALFILISVIVFIPYGIYCTVKDGIDCQSKGGVTTRAGCLKPEVIIK